MPKNVCVLLFFFSRSEATKTTESPEQTFVGVLSAKCQPVFGAPPLLVTKSIDQQLKTSWSPFGNFTFGSNFPSFSQTKQSIVSLQTTEAVSPTNEYLRVNKLLTSSNEVSTVLYAVGLIKNHRYAAKCYPQKKSYRSVKSFDVTMDFIDLKMNKSDDFGKLNWLHDSE